MTVAALARSGLARRTGGTLWKLCSLRWANYCVAAGAAKRPLAWLKRVLCGTRRLSKDLSNGLRHASNRADAPQARSCEKRRTGHSERRRQRDLQDKHRVIPLNMPFNSNPSRHDKPAFAATLHEGRVSSGA
jgi:hypothetical protein